LIMIFHICLNNLESPIDQIQTELKLIYSVSNMTYRIDSE